MPNQPFPTQWPIYAGLPTPCLLLTPDLVIAAANKAYIIQAGLQNEDITGQPFFDTLQLDEAAREKLRYSFKQVLDTHQEDEVQLASYVTPAMAAYAPGGWNIKNMAGPRKGRKTSCIIHFITPVHVAAIPPSAAANAPAPQEPLTISVKKYAIFSLDKNGIITSWNKGAENIKGYKANEIIGKHVSILYTTQDNA